MKKIYFMFMLLIGFFCRSNLCIGWTVEYTDGSNEELYFHTQRYSGVPDGHASPGYSGDPMREGYVFVGWSPEETNNVRSDITYVAQWKPDRNGDGIADVEWTIEYTDGSNNELYFKTQRYLGVPDGHATPGYSGDPRREGYVFVGWSPEETSIATRDVTYVAQWKPDRNGDGIADVEWTIEYTDGSNNELYFKTQRYLGVPDGHATPGYSGDPKREGYTFAGWSPKEASIATKDVVYVAQWKANSEVYTNDTRYSDEFNQAYRFAYTNGITTQKTIESAKMNSPLTRIAMAKMLSNYAINVLGKDYDTHAYCVFNDVPWELDAQYDNGVTWACKLGIMGVGIRNFRPNDSVTRAEFGTALSRLLFGTTDGEGAAYYEPHLRRLMQENIITVNDPKIEEKRGYVMLMLMRSAD